MVSPVLNVRALTLGIAAALLAACAVGPDYVRPDVPTPEHFVQAEAAASEPASASAVGGNVPVTSTPATNGSFALASDSEFWRDFNDPLLTRLVEDSLAANHDLRIALANYDRANALLRGAKFDFFPTVTAHAQSRGWPRQCRPGLGRGTRGS
jgi:outer membrane protein TolC